MIAWVAAHVVALLALNLVLAALLHLMARGLTEVETRPRLGPIALEGVVVGAGGLIRAPATDRPCVAWWLSLPYAPVDRHQMVSDWAASILLRLASGTTVDVSLPPRLIAYIGNPELGSISQRERGAAPEPKNGGLPAPGTRVWEEVVCVGDHVYIAGEFEGPKTWAGNDPMRSTASGGDVEMWTMVRRGAIHVGSARDLRFLGRVSRWRLRHSYIFFVMLNISYAGFAGWQLGLW